MNNRLAHWLMALILSLGLASQAQSLPLLQFNSQGSYTVATGDVLSESLRISGLGGEIVSAFDLDVLYDSSLLSLQSVTLDAIPFMGGPSDTLFDSTISAPGTLNAWILSLLSDADIASLQAPLLGSFSLFTMDFVAIGDGTTEFAIGPLSVANGKVMTGFNNNPILPNEAPEPASLMLLALGLVGLGVTHISRMGLVARQ